MKKILCCMISLFLIASASTISFAAAYPTEPPYKFYSIAGQVDHGVNLGVVQVDRSVIYGSELSQVSYSNLMDMCVQLNSAQSYYRFAVVCVLSSDAGKRYMVNALHSVSSGNGFSSTYEGRLGGYNSSSKTTVIYYAFVSAESSTGSGSGSGSGSGTGSGSGAVDSPSGTDYTSLLEWIGDNLVRLCDICENFRSSLLFKLEGIESWFNAINQNLLSRFDIVTSNQLAQYELLTSFLVRFDSLFSDLDLDYYNDAEIVVNNGGHLDWSESDRGAIDVVATDIGTLELVGFPDVTGYVVDHDVGGDLIVCRNDGTYFPNTWELSGGTVTMPAIVEGYASITVTAPAGAVISVAGNTHTMASEPYTVNVGFGSYTIDVSYTDGEEVKTAAKTITVDGYNDYAVDFSYTPGGFVVMVSRKQTSDYHFITIDGTTYSAAQMSTTPREFLLSVGSVVTFSVSGGNRSQYISIDGTMVASSTKNDYSYTVVSDCSIFYTGSTWSITTSDTASIVGDFDTPTVTITANPSTSTPLTIQSLVLAAGSSHWQAIDTEGNTYDFDPVSNLALNRSFVVKTYTAEEVAALDNFPSGYWTVSWTGESKYITVKFEEYSKFFLWLNRFLINFRDTLYTKMEDITVTASGDVILNSKDYTNPLNDIITRMDTIIDLLQNTSGDTACEHVYEQSMATDATCALPGLMVSTCSLCGDSYSEIVDPLGHDWKCTGHITAVTDPETGEETAAAYDIYTCSRCGDTYNDYSGDGAPEDYGKSSISRLIVELFSRLGKLAGSLVGFVVNVFDKALTSVDDLISRFNSYTEQITGFGGAYPEWLGGLWGILPADLQVALTFAVVCMAVALVGKKLVFS